ncbi:hypothetical protein [Leptospira borgpetersenii]|uniref:hypothetical protein n=1 Tax=Leptospira borgpetersenii TaxID=174 RepID=UPI000772D72D|nr:hypothetical protein [Leptospira borgpetersenii]MBE8364995.1 hypothetical protein [Leptospira borgpetersenii serovar Balcanica]MBE8368547.1 hypothetical protein [Leptospira borgpetersenii serovar Balcanica]MBE8399263.1 hypothetical protein [Leptospira borgpetersenii serovar Tarassovi]MBE8404340.1 hypothetical protein [Leptospira borgpetersenii serovar Tarassovi]MBE8404847.1 hypothetical protein [Leptospira borgpetersenii serovar Tarassovi]
MKRSANQKNGFSKKHIQEEKSYKRYKISFSLISNIESKRTKYEASVTYFLSQSKEWILVGVEIHNSEK